jgi:hypothetical protein
MGRKPKLTVILDVNKRRLAKKKVISITGKEGSIDIARNLPPDAYNLDPKLFFRELFFRELYFRELCFKQEGLGEQHFSQQHPLTAPKD